MIGTPLPRSAIHDQRVTRAGVENEERVVAARQLQVAEGDVEIGVERRRHVGAETPDRVEWDQAAFDLAAARVRLSVRDRDARWTEQARVLLVPLIPDPARVEMH